MVDCTVCNVCDGRGRIEDARESRQVACNVRAYRHEIFLVWRCPSCGSLHCKQEVDLDFYYRNYPVQAHRLDFWARAAYANYLRRLSRSGIQRNQSVLDYGCGPGLLIQFLRQRGFRDVSGYDAHVPEFSSLVPLQRTYDCIIAQDVIEHVENPREWLEWLVGRLKPGGVMCIGTPNASGIDLGKPEIFALSLHQPYHRHLLSRQALLAMAENSGLSPIAKYDRFYYDTLYPTVNYRFLREYVRSAGNVLDAAFEDPKIGLVLSSPRLWFYAVFGYFIPPRSEMMVIFRGRG